MHKPAATVSTANEYPMSTQTVLSPANAAYLDALYEQYMADPASVDENLRAYFATLDQTDTPTSTAPLTSASIPLR